MMSCQASWQDKCSSYVGYMKSPSNLTLNLSQNALVIVFSLGASNTVFLGAQGDLQPNKEVKK